MVFGGGAVGGNAIGAGIVISLYDSFSQNADKISNKFKTLEGLAEEAGQRIDASLNKMKVGFAGMVIGAAITLPFIAATSAAMEFEKGMAKINTTAQLSQTELGNLRDQLLTIGAGSTGDLNKIPDAFEKIISQTGDTKLSLDILKSATKGAQAGFTDIDVVAGALAQTLSIVGKANTDAATVMDTLFAAKRVGAGEFKDFAAYLPTLIAAGSNLGYTFKETSGIFAYFTGKGQDAANSAMLMQNAFSALQKVDIQKGLKKSGVNIFDETGKMRDVVSIFKDLNSVMGSLTQQQKTSLLDKVGLKDVQARNAFAILSSDIGKLQEAMNATDNPAGELSKALEYGMNSTQKFEIALNKIKSSFVKLGTIFMPLVADIAQVVGEAFTSLANIFSSIASNPIGRFVIKLVAGFGVLLFTIGAFVVVTNAAKYAAAQASISFAAMGMTEVATAFATGGLTGGMIALGAAIWTALAPLIPFIAAGALIIAVFYGMYKGFQAFNDLANGTGERLTGIAGLFQKIGGVIQGVMEIWNSATNEGFSLSGKTYAALQKLGIAEFVVNLGTWIVRLKSIFTSMFEVIIPIVSQFWGVFKGLFSWLAKTASSIFESFGFSISKLGGHMSTFIGLGKLLGGIISAVLVVAFGVLSGVMAIASGVIIVIMGAFRLLWDVIQIGIAVIVASYQYFMAWGGFVMDVIRSVVNFALDLLSGKTFKEAGANMVSGIMEGILSAWDALKAMFTGLIKALPFGDKVLAYFGAETTTTLATAGATTGANQNNGGGGVVSPTPGTEPINGPTPLGVATVKAKGTGSAQDSGTKTVTNTEKVEVIRDINLHLDGKKIKAKMDSIDQENDSRK